MDSTPITIRGEFRYDGHDSPEDEFDLIERRIEEAVPMDVESVEPTRDLAAAVGDLASDEDADLTAHERSELEEAAHLIHLVEEER